jgi:hypothetical protein
LFNETQIKISNRITINFINIDNYSIEFISLIKAEITAIWDGDFSEDDLNYVKKQMRSFFKDKDNEKKLAFVAEFICHLYLRYQGFQQYSVLKNLEEIKAPKKGFDGLYEFDNSMWLVESKCAMPTTETNHNRKISEAYNDLKNKIELTRIEDNENNPWENAKNHFIHTEKKNEALIKQIKKLKILFIDGCDIKINKFNVIPCSTLYLEEKWKIIDSDELKVKLEKMLKRYKAQKINVLCINKKSITNFINFIKE